MLATTLPTAENQAYRVSLGCYRSLR